MALFPALATLLLAAPIPAEVPAAVTSTTLLRTGTSWNGRPLQMRRSERPEVQTVVVEIAPGARTAWHLHAVVNIAYILEGRVRIELEEGKTREFGAGESFAEVVDTWHRGVNVGPGPLKILVVYLGEAGVPISTAKAPPAAGMP